MEHDSHDLGDAIEAVQNFLAGRDYDVAARIAGACFAELQRFRQSVGIAALASEVLESLPHDHSGYAAIADAEAQAHLALGLTECAFERYMGLLGQQEEWAQAEPDRADYQRDLSVSYNKVGDLYSALGQGDKGRLASSSLRRGAAKPQPSVTPGRARCPRASDQAPPSRRHRP